MCSLAFGYNSITVDSTNSTKLVPKFLHTLCNFLFFTLKTKVRNETGARGWNGTGDGGWNGTRDGGWNGTRDGGWNGTGDGCKLCTHLKRYLRLQCLC